MTGLDSRSERLLEVACIITDAQLNPVDEGVSYVIRTPRAVLDGMDAWCRKTHKATGLTDTCLSFRAFDHNEVRTALLAYILDRVPEAQSACLAGNTVHADKTFLVKEMPEVRRAAYAARRPFALPHRGCEHHQGAGAALVRRRACVASARRRAASVGPELTQCLGRHSRLDFRYALPLTRTGVLS